MSLKNMKEKFDELWDEYCTSYLEHHEIDENLTCKMVLISQVQGKKV